MFLFHTCVYSFWLNTKNLIHLIVSYTHKRSSAFPDKHESPIGIPRTRISVVNRSEGISIRSATPSDRQLMSIPLWLGVNPRNLRHRLTDVSLAGQA